MDYNNQWREMQTYPPQNPNSQPLDPYSHHHHHLYTTQFSQNPNPNPNHPITHLSTDPLLQPHDPHYTTSSSSFLQTHVGGYEAYHQPSVVAYAQPTLDAGTVAVNYYQDPNVIAAIQNWASLYAPGVTIPPNGMELLVPAQVSPTTWTKAKLRPRGNNTWKRDPKKTKVVQSAWCEVCKVECNSQDVLEQHKLGKKHMKNMEKLKEATAPPPVASGVSNNPVIGPQENPDKGKAASVQKTKNKAAEPVEDLEMKKRKILEGGAAADAMMTCTVCNVVCNSEIVFQSHVAGRKHATMLKKHARGGAGVVTATAAT
ncbi:hypothetical protein CsSME_00005249 [Camellia sinensis var. sinensis]